MVVYVMFLCDVACQKLLNSANVSRSYSQNNTGTVFLRHGVESLTYILPLTIWVYLYSNFSGGLRKMILFLQERCFSRSRSSKVIEFGTKLKRVCNFLLVHNSNLGPTLHRFGDIPAFVCS